MSKLASILRLTRIEHSVMLVVAVVAAEIIAYGIPALPVFALSLVAPVFISMAAFAINDYFDVKVDRANRKKRPLVTGELTKAEALYITAICLVVGIGASAFINTYAFYIAVIFGALALLYSYRLKEMLFWGNAYIAFSMAVPFIFGDYVVTNVMVPGILLVSAMIFLAGLAREIHGTIRDMKGDGKVRNVVSFPKVIGVAASAALALVLYSAAIVISFYLFVFVQPFASNLLYGIIVLASVDIILVYLSIAYLYRSGQRFYDCARDLSLQAMALALVAILLSAIIPLYI